MDLFAPEFLEATGVIVSITLIIVLIRRGWAMYLVMALATLILALSNGNPALENLALLYQSLTSETAIYLVSMVVAISLLGHLHQEIGAMEKLVGSLRLLIRDPRALLMIFPAAVSFFSIVPGGAIISAPMVAETGRELNMPPLELAMSNMVYRHVIVLINPLNSGIILASGITGLSIAGYLSFSIPVVLTVYAIATLILYKRYPGPRKEQPPTQKKPGSGGAVKDLTISALPYILAITLGLAFNVYFPFAILAGILSCLLLYLEPSKVLPAIAARLGLLARGLNWPIALSTLTIVFFKDFMLEAQSFQQLVGYLVNLGLPLIVLVVVLPFFTGFISGHNTASLGIAIPVLMPFLAPDLLTIRYLGLIYISSYAGYNGSPIHLCTYLTNNYFKTPLFTLIKGINVYGAIMLVVGLVLALFY